MPFVKLTTVAEVPEGEIVCCHHGDRQVAVVNVGGELFAIDNVCTHAGAPLDEGTLGLEGDYLITCPWHDAHFDCRTGKADPDTPWGEDTEAYAVRVDGDDVWVELPED